MHLKSRRVCRCSTVLPHPGRLVPKRFVLITCWAVSWTWEKNDLGISWNDNKLVNFSKFKLHRESCCNSKWKPHQRKTQCMKMDRRRNTLNSHCAAGQATLWARSLAIDSKPPNVRCWALRSSYCSFIFFTCTILWASVLPRDGPPSRLRIQTHVPSLGGRSRSPNWIHCRQKGLQLNSTISHRLLKTVHHNYHISLMYQLQLWNFKKPQHLEQFLCAICLCFTGKDPGLHHSKGGPSHVIAQHGQIRQLQRLLCEPTIRWKQSMPKPGWTENFTVNLQLFIGIFDWVTINWIPVKLAVLEDLLRYLTSGMSCFVTLGAVAQSLSQCHQSICGCQSSLLNKKYLSCGFVSICPYLNQNNPKKNTKGRSNTRAFFWGHKVVILKPVAVTFKMAMDLVAMLLDWIWAEKRLGDFCFCLKIRCVFFLAENFGHGEIYTLKIPSING